MPKSMTGFGRGETVRPDRRIKIEIKAVNHRFSDFTFKMPRLLNPLEERIRRRLAETITRGKVDIWLHYESFAQRDASISVNQALADAYVEALTELSNRYDFGRADPKIILEVLAKHPDIITFDKQEITLNPDSDQEEMWEIISEALEDAIKEFNQMRCIEGRAMAQDIENHRLQAQGIVSEIAKHAPEALRAQAARFRERLDEIVLKMEQKPDEVRLVTEMAIISDKGCINEEIARLHSHFGQISTILQETDAIGRKLDFIVQELNREANTIGSKSGDVGITNLVVELKSLIEKMREQAQNIE